LVCRVLRVAEALRAELAGFDPASYSGTDCAELAEALALTEKTCGAARARAAARAVACRAHEERGFTDGADWLARRAGKSLAEARAELATGGSLETMPATLQATVAGELSLAQAAEVARAAGVAPGSEARLLELAKRSGLPALRHEARKVALGAIRPEELSAAQQTARRFRHWTDALGMVCGSFALPPAVGVPLVNRVEAEAHRLRRGAGSAGREGFEAYAADALATLLQGKARGGPVKTEVVYVAEWEAVRRGHAHPGEPCHIVGGGPVPASHVAEVARDAFIKAVLYKGTEIRTVAHFGRHINAELRTALALGRPPDFEGVVCAEAGCGRRYGLEWDHVEPRAHDGPTSYDNLVALCSLCGIPHKLHCADRRVMWNRGRKAFCLNGSRSGSGHIIRGLPRRREAGQAAGSDRAGRPAEWCGQGRAV
jgi:hypothetical protein